MTNHSRHHLLSLVTDETGQYLAIHVDLRGINILIDQLPRLKSDLELNDCPHTHLFVNSDPSARELTSSKLADQEPEVSIVHHLKICGWNEEWARRHGLRPRNEIITGHLK